MIVNKFRNPIKVGVLGFGGLGQAAARVLAPKGEMVWVAAADRKGYAVAAQSYAEIHSVKITFGVGIANGEAYRATIREDIAHMPGFDVETARAMTDEEVAALLDKTNGIHVLLTAAETMPQFVR